ncbi:histone-lysine N-methyltransferase, H3 lysine-9 specific, putative [Trichomonas vaginalis G3]|uniref:Histone-lysine N-methyltransferase, H3 lysine-9 specific, putative n=1 Tax=Trichomonas vaginalis (strain ATCC PRA-98 / G3) TaxID=412133 RepID=A2EG19_TRIV3|nr:spectrin binding [Trichomonas vaginalis G3]EAY08380.1 histone-lysine N-methyltransferase, H3 lysine-9 specific, putative [Trichomonas vaginalis G3]KAI5499340.1 spectrin binding [Trichomonas vaginalis G3]|eukprot:XP_001320603.1 histone-lysine N-methyltransferase, H3 lysine-9 specific [Trichomonas vaginalis G3]
MSLIRDYDYIASNIQTYIDQDNFYDIVDKEFIPQVLEKANLNSNDFKTLLSQGLSKYSTKVLYELFRNCNVFINSFEDVINVLQSYSNIFRLLSSCSLIDYLEKFNSENQSDSIEITNLQNLESKISMLENEINEYRWKEVQYKNEIAQISEIPLNSDFETAYNFLKQLSNKGDKLKMSLSCAVGLSEKRSSNDYTPLHYACCKGDLQFIKSLVEEGCDRDAATKNESNCLLMASYYGHLDIVKYLIGVGFEKNYCKKSSGFNAIIMASQEGQLEVVKYLKSIGCDVNSKTNGNASCIYFASLKGHLEVVKYLFSSGANPYEKDDNGVSPLIVASQEGHLDIVKYLIQCGCNKNDKTNYNDSSLHWAAENGNFEVVEYLVSI